MKEKTAIDKLRNIVAWANNMDEHFNDTVRNPLDWLILHALANRHDIEFIDELDDSPGGVHADFIRDANYMLGYKLFNL